MTNTSLSKKTEPCVIEPLQIFHYELIIELVANRVAQEGLLPAFYWPEESLRAELASARGFVAVNENNEILAFCLYRDMKFDWELSCLATAMGQEGRGFMRALLAHLLSHRLVESSYISNNIRVFLEVHVENKRAQRLYEALGFCSVGERKFYYRDGASAFVYLA